MIDWRIETGDALELIPRLEDGSVQLVVTSPPYPGQYGNKLKNWQWLPWARQWIHALRPKLAENGVLVLNVQFKRDERGWFDYSIYNLAHPGYTGLETLDLYIYGKMNPPPNGPLTYCDPPGWEFVFVLTNADAPGDVFFEPARKPYARKSIRASDGRVYVGNGSGLVGGRNGNAKPHPEGARQSTLMLMSMSGDQKRPRAKGHSFPRELPERFIRQYTRPGDLVLDPFCGVGTTGQVAVELGRRFVGFEKDAGEAERARAWVREVEAANAERA